MIDDLEGEAESSATIWAAFGDLMSVLLGAFVLILVGVIGMQLQLRHAGNDAEFGGLGCAYDGDGVSAHGLSPSPDGRRGG